MSRWVDSYGREHLPEYMSEHYLMNCINYIKKMIKADPDYLPPPSYESLLKEYERRKNDVM